MSLEHIFRAYDIRGKTGRDVTPDVMEDIGRAYAAYLGGDTIVVGHDVRTTSPELSNAFVHGATSTGADVIDAGFAPYGSVLFGGWKNKLPSAYVTASHLPREWNGVKFAHPNGVGFTEEENMAVRDQFFDGRFPRGRGNVTEQDAIGPYKKHLLSQVKPKKAKVLMDCGNGSACAVAPDLFQEAGVDLDVINGEPDGTFPNRPSDVTPGSLKRLRSWMQEDDHDIGFAYDGDADRVAAVDDTGRVLSAEQLAAVLMSQLLEVQDGPVIANVECSRMLEHMAKQHGRKVIRVRVGHTYLFRAMHEHNACLGVEKSGHIGIPHVLPLDDGIATSLYAADVVSRLDRPVSSIVNALPDYYRGRFPFEVADEDKFAVINALQDRFTREYEHTSTMDGIRIDFDTAWVLIRASNTSPKIRLTVEAESSEHMEKLQYGFMKVITDTIEDVERGNY